MKDLHQQWWVKAFNFENDPALLPGYRRWAERIGVSVVRIREVILAARKYHANRIGPRHLDQYAPPPTMTWLSQAAGVPRHQAKAVWNSAFEIGFFEAARDGRFRRDRFRPVQSLLDEKFAWGTAKRLLDGIPEPDNFGQGTRKERHNGRGVPPSGRRDTTTVSLRPPPPEGPNGRSVPIAAPEAAPNAGFGPPREAPQKQKSPAGDIEKEKEAATVTPSTAIVGTTKTTPDPMNGPDPEGHNTHSGGAAPDDPALAQDGGPCADCGRQVDESDPKQKAIATFVRNRRRAGDAIRWSHNLGTWSRCP